MNIVNAYLLIGNNILDNAKEMAQKILNKALLNNPDFKLIDTKDTNIKIEEIRALIEKVYEKPISGEKKVYIINNAEKLTKEAANCLLKTLEEPPEYITIILTTTNEEMMLPTIKSRCVVQNINTSKQIETIDFNEIDFSKQKDDIFNILDGINVNLLNKLKKTGQIRYANNIEAVEKAKKRLKANANYDMTIDSMILELKGEL